MSSPPFLPHIQMTEERLQFPILVSEDEIISDEILSEAVLFMRVNWKTRRAHASDSLFTPLILLPPSSIDFLEADVIFARVVLAFLFLFLVWADLHAENRINCFRRQAAWD